MPGPSEKSYNNKCWKRHVNMEISKILLPNSQKNMRKATKMDEKLYRTTVFSARYSRAFQTIYHL